MKSSECVISQTLQIIVHDLLDSKKSSKIQWPRVAHTFWRLPACVSRREFDEGNQTRVNLILILNFDQYEENILFLNFKQKCRISIFCFLFYPHFYAVVIFAYFE